MSGLGRNPFGRTEGRATRGEGTLPRAAESGGGRTPQELLDALERELHAAFRRPPRRGLGRVGRRGWRRIALAAGLVAAAGASTAAATRQIFAPAPPLPQLERVAAVLAHEEGGRAPWQLSVAHCSTPAAGFSVLLRAGRGGAGSPCGPLVQPPIAFYGADRTIVFGAVPAGAERVQLTVGSQRRELTPSEADPDALRAQRLPPGVRVYVAELPAATRPTALTAFDRSGQIVLTCQEHRCETP